MQYTTQDPISFNIAIRKLDTHHANMLTNSYVLSSNNCNQLFKLSIYLARDPAPSSAISWIYPQPCYQWFTSVHYTLLYSKIYSIQLSYSYIYTHCLHSQLENNRKSKPKCPLINHKALLLSPYLQYHCLHPREHTSKIALCRHWPQQVSGVYVVFAQPVCEQLVPAAIVVLIVYCIDTSL